MQSLRQHRQIATRLQKWSDGQNLESEPSGHAGASQPVSSPSSSHWDEFDNDLDPKNWPFSKKLGATMLVTAIAFNVQYASAVDSAAADEIRKDFGVSAVAESLATGLFLVGFSIGAPVAGPLSEIAGRNLVYMTSLAAFMLCTLGAGLAPNLGTQLAMRFLAGMFGSTPLVCAGGTVSDLWSPFEQIYIFPVYATCGFLGVAVGPAIGGVIAESNLVSWRWVEWSTLIMSGVVFVLVILFQPETYAPVLLEWKAAAMTSATEPNLEAVTPSVSRLSKTLTATQANVQELGSKIGRSFYRPVQLAVSEPIVIMISVYLSVLYIVMFTFLPGYSFIFTDTYGFGQAQRGLSFLGMGVGFILGLTLTIPITFVSKRLVRRNGELCPESTLYYAMCGAPTIPIALFWMAWTTKSYISPWSALAASALFGFGVVSVFFSSYQYIIRTYGQYAASGLVFVTLTRYLVAGGMVTVGIPMYGNLGVAHTLTILGALAVVLVPIPFCLYVYGPTIRKWSKYAP